MDHTPLDQGMFWVGAMMVFTPMIFAGIVLGVWWRGKQREEREREQAAVGAGVGAGAQPNASPSKPVS